MVTTYSINGYVVVPPASPWDKKELVIPAMSYRSFSQTPTEAWLRHMQTTEWDSLKVNRWIDRGYRLRNATLTIEDEDE